MDQKALLGGNNCGDAASGPVPLAVTCIILLGIARALNKLLQPLGQPEAVSHVLAGILVGSVIQKFLELNTPSHGQINFEGPGFFALDVLGRYFFMFLMGLELDIPYIWRTRRRSLLITFGGGIACTIMALMTCGPIYRGTESKGGFRAFTFMLIMIYANTASPLLVRMAAEYKLAPSGIGRLAIASALVNDMASLLGVAMITNHRKHFSGGAKFGIYLGGITVIIVSGFFIRSLVKWMNRRNRERKGLKHLEIIVLITFGSIISALCLVCGFDGMIAAFVMGVVFPREGRASRTLLQQLAYPVHHFVLPIYFCITGLKANLFVLDQWNHLPPTICIFVFSTMGKVGGTILATMVLKMPLNEGFVLGLMLNVKGHVDLIILSQAMKNKIISKIGYNMMIVTVALSTVITGPVWTFMVRKERNRLSYQHVGIEWQQPETELRTLACVHKSRHIPTMLKLIGATRGTERTPSSPFLLHLMEQTHDHYTTNILFNQQNEDYEDESKYGTDDAKIIYDAVDIFCQETGVSIRQMKAISAHDTTYQDVCQGAEDIRASIIILPFHKNQRADGRMEADKEGYRATNSKVLENATCTVGILIDRGFGGTTQVSAAQKAHHIAVLFFGGPDDREALAYACRIVHHPGMTLTVLRFLPSAKSDYDDEIPMEATIDNRVRMSIVLRGTEKEIDADFLSHFHNRYVVTGLASYIEKFVDNGSDTVSTLSAMEGLYSLYIVGKGQPGLSPLTMGMGDWLETSELGPIGDLLASSDFTISGSVLVIQQHKLSLEGQLQGDVSSKKCLQEDFTVS